MDTDDSVVKARGGRAGAGWSWAKREEMGTSVTVSIILKNVFLNSWSPDNNNPVL